MTLLRKLEEILDSHPFIDELGFIHPSQFATLEKENPEDEFFWCNETKLGISTSAIVPLYREAKEAFFDALHRYRKLSDDESRGDSLFAGNEVMKHSMALVLVSCDFGTAWNSRKLIISSSKLMPEHLSDELMLSALVLSSSPKSERAWSHRRWVIKTMGGKRCPDLGETVERECNLVKTIVDDRSKMNYRAWSHLCWLVSYMTHEKIAQELKNFRDWAGLHVADNSCFHYRTRLLLHMMENLKQSEDTNAFSDAGFHQVWEEELEWVGSLIRRYIGREALWIHRRFLSLLWMKEHLLLPLNDSTDICSIDVFIKEELDLVRSCGVIPDTDFEDYQEQAIHSATYGMWIAKQVPVPFGVELIKKSPQYEKVKLLLDNSGKSYVLEFLAY